MKKSEHQDLPPRMPPELEKVHAALERIQIEERSSFGVELRAELEQEWRRLKAQPAAPRRHTGRYAAAAAAAVLVIGTLAVPPARASLVRLIFPVAEPVEEVVETVTKMMTAPAPPAAEDPPAQIRGTPPPVDEVVVDDLPEWPAPMPTTFPVLLDRTRAREIVANEYPDSLQRAEVGGKVRVLLWVRPDGGVDYTQVGKTSGVPDLDMAALRATRSLRFLPATRAGTAVGTWVEFTIEFRPSTWEPPSDPADHGIQIPLSN